MTTDTTPRTANRYQKTMIWGGGILALVGGVAALLFVRAVDQAMMTAEFRYAQGGGYDPSAAQAAVVGFWVAVVLAVVGVVALVVALVLRNREGAR